MTRLALVLQLLGLAGLPIGGVILGDLGGAVIGASVSAVYVGAAMDRAMN